MRTRILAALAVALLAGSAQAQVNMGAIQYTPPPNVMPAGASIGLTATYGAEMAPAITAATWTCGAGWDCSVTGTLNKNADGVGTAAPTTPLAITAGVTYRVTITVGALTVASGATYTLGGLNGTPLTAATTYTDYITASTTGSLIITPTPTATRFAITAISVVPLTDATGDLTVDGNLTVRSGSLFGGQVLMPSGSAASPSSAFRHEPTTGPYREPGETGSYSISLLGTTRHIFRATSHFISSGTATLILNTTYVGTGGANIVVLGNAASTAAAQTLKAQDSSGAGVAGANLTVRGGSGTGSTNPAGGNLILGGGAPNGTGARGVVAIEDGGTKPTCAVGIRGAFWYDAGGAGVADTYEVCLKNAADVYTWAVSATPVP